MFAQSCYPPIPVTYYKPLNEGKRVGHPDTIMPNDRLLFNIHNGVIARTNIWAHYTGDISLSVIFVVPKEQTVRLASDKIEIHSPELSSPVTGRVKSIKEMEGRKSDTEYLDMAKVKTSDGRIEVPPLGPYDELYGYKVNKPSFYLLSIEYANKIQVAEEHPLFKYPNSIIVTEDHPQNVTVFLPDIYINDELHKIEPLKFKLTRGVGF